MFEAKIPLNECDTCNKCGREFRNEEEIYRFYENKKFYCDECADEMKEEGAESHKFHKYCVMSDHAVIVLEYNTVPVLEDGLYKVFKLSWTVEKFGDESKELWPQAYMQLKDEENEVIEIRNHKAVCFFSDSDCNNKYSLDIHSDIYEEYFTDICPDGKYEECYFIVLMDQIIGITTKEAAESISGFKTFGYGNLAVKPYEEIKRMAGKNKFQRMLCSALQKLTPSVMLEECRKRVQGQPMIKTAVFIIYNYLLALESGDLKAAENWILTAPSGSGKTEFYRALRDIFKKYNIPVPVTNVDLSLITEAGYRGDNVDSIHDKLMEADSESDGYGICFLDEADKKFLPSHSGKGDNVNAAVQANLLTMIERFRKKLSLNTKVINISEFPIKGGCLGCFKCAVSGHCFYKDGYENLLREEIQSCDATVYAFKIKDHSMGPRFKMYDDRQFCNGHRTVTTGMPVGYLVSGDLSGEENLRMIMEARAQVGGNFLSGIASDTSDPNREIDMLAEKLAYALENAYTQPQNFYGIGGMKIFRDLIWQMRGMMRADHKFYKAHGQYDFPQKKPFKALAMYAVGALIANPKIKAKMGNRMNEGMLMPYKKVLESIKTE